MRTSQRVVLASVISVIAIYALIVALDPNRAQLLTLDNILALNLTGIVAVLILVGAGALVVMYMNERRGSELASVIGPARLEREPSPAPVQRRAAVQAADPIRRAPVDPTPEPAMPEPAIKAPLEPSPTAPMAADPVIHSTPEPEPIASPKPTDQRMWIGAGAVAVVLLVAYLTVSHRSDKPAFTAPAAGIPEARTAPADSPCEVFGTVKTPYLNSDPKNCKELASTLHISEAEMVRRFRIMYARNVCEAGVSTRQGQDECAVKYPFDW